FPTAEAAAKKALELDSEDVAAHKILAKIYAKEGNNLGMTEELTAAKKSEEKFAAAHPELVKKPEPAPAKPQEEEEKEEKQGKQEDYQVIGQCIGQWNQMKDEIMHDRIDAALPYYSDYLDTRDQYRDSFNKLGVQRLKS